MARMFAAGFRTAAFAILLCLIPVSGVAAQSPAPVTAQAAPAAQHAGGEANLVLPDLG